MSQYTCFSCRVAFANGDIQRQHYKTDWHRYNLKRKVVQLPPVTAEDFQLRVLQQRQKDADDEKDTSTFCKACRKSFASKNTFDNHLNSKRHRECVIELENEGDIAEPVIKRVARAETEIVGDDEMETDSEIEEVDSDEWNDEDDISDDNPIVQNDCLFCNHHSASFTKNVKHMSVEHSFFIPDADFLVDPRSLLLYLGEKVCRFFVCLWCNDTGRAFHSAEAVRGHMRDKGHCKMLHDGLALAEYERFYNYAQSYPDYEGALDMDEEVNIPTLEPNDDFQLTLPSGNTIGHRSLVVYYKQNFGKNHSEGLTKRSKLSKVLASYRALGWTSTDKEAARRKAKDIQYFKMVQTKFYTQLGVKANKLQKHFRPQVNF